MYYANLITYSALSVGGIFIMINSIQLGYRSSGMMGPGFFPFWIGLLLTALSIISIIKELISKNNKKNESFASRTEIALMLKIVIGASITIVISKVTGFLFALGILSGYMGIIFGIKKWSKIILLSVFIPGLLYLLFVLTFKVPIPKGLFSLNGVIL